MSEVRTNRALYSKLLISITLCISLTLIGSTLIYYTYYIKVEKTEAFRSDLRNLTQTSSEVVNMTGVAQSLSFQIYRNSTISKIVFYDKPDIYDVTSAMSELGNYLNSMPYIESIYVYNPDNERVYIASSHGQNGVFNEKELEDQGILYILDHYQDNKPFMPIPRIYPSNEKRRDKVSSYTFLCFDSIGWDRSLNSAVIVNISAPWINKEITKDIDSKSTTFILEDQGKFLSADSLAELDLSTDEHKWIQEQIKGSSAGYFIAPFKGEKSLVSFTSPDDLNWQYVRITPYDEITKHTDDIRNATLLMAFVIIIAGLVLSQVVSRRLYIPIDRIVNEMNVLETEKRNSMFTIKQNMLRDFVLGLKPLHTIQQVEKLRQLGIHFTFNEDYRLVLLRIDNYAEYRETRSSYLLAYKFAIMNIASEICGQTYRVETVDMNDDGILILLNIIDPIEDTATELIETLLRQIQQACFDYLKIGLTSTYSPIDQNPMQLNQLYKQLREASNHRLFLGHGSIINANSISVLKSNVYHYPTEKEKKFTEALMSCKTEEARQYFSDIIRGTEHFPFHAVQLAVSRLSLTVKDIISNIQKRNQLHSQAEPELPSIEAIETISELEEAYFTLFSEIQEKLADKKNSKQHELIRQIDQKITDSYMDSNLSLNQIADALNMSPIYISRLYKQQTMSSIVDVILEVRMREVCSLLENTDLSVTAVAEQCGFTSSSYLHRMFKRSFGITPTDYRRTKKS
ncbi:AraC family transcriptional regulator [Paenibacillus wynnii]|uniref:AraC family transcriptional regulator n=2 Tax=Paenibacillus wynnii TaxID=268407 RepID=A0A098MFT6_9BACL|nr:AraC family transcriptional regulator [Paenibacillus wynnii]